MTYIYGSNADFFASESVEWMVTIYQMTCYAAPVDDGRGRKGNDTFI